MGGIRVLPIMVLAVAAVLAQSASAEPRGKGRLTAVGKAHGAIPARDAGTGGRVIRRHTRDEDRVVRIIDDIFNGTDGLPRLPPGLAKGRGVPPGLENRSELPPGLR